MKKIKIIKNRSDIGAGTRGSDMGVDAIEIAAINANSDYFNNYEYTEIPTENEAVYAKQKTLFAKRVTKVLAVCKRLSSAVRNCLEEENFPIVLSGDHSSALGTISGIKAAFPHKELGVIWIDAHADVHSPYTTPSGNVHGMPLAAALSEDNLDRKINDLAEETNESWEGLKNIDGISPKVRHSNVVYFGVRDIEEPEEYLIEKYNIKNYKVAEIRHRGMDVCMEETLGKLKECDLIYISFDVDSMDCDLVSKGTGTPVSKGFDKEEVKQIINKIIESKKVTCIEIVEVNPLLDDKGNSMAEAAFDVLSDFTKTIEKINIK